ncbi:hypothetical protein [Methylobacterium nonmethylotrophicum]|uniref:Uncharacterized protein n=1 Tax=Methylobacterium nonmethylotrophicum TaxID=1141884 RepID=A0A4Z0NSJ5_9HYPH|nr:hypothetical protein [Methylobacterium nonmethylotrophicum]TGE00242.1 hypothetical protein EU555_10115 [Methylobacterium nonmethylotrophicum]
MTTLTLFGRPAWLLAAAGFGLAWNAFGIVRFCATATSSEAGLAAMGMTPAQAALHAGLPAWMTLAFAAGVVGGFAGCALLLAGSRRAGPVLAGSLVAYAALFAGDVVHGVFAAFGPAQVAIIAAALLIAIGLFCAATVSARRSIYA